MQTLKFIGRGSAFNTEAGNTSAYYKSNGHMLLIDCGETVFAKIIELNLLEDVKEIDVLITHLHSDHIGSLSTLIYYCKYKLNIPVGIYYPTNELDTLLKAMGHTDKDYLYLNPETSCIYNIEFLPRTVKHIDDKACYGYQIAIDEIDIWYSGDCSEFAWEPEELELFDEIYQDTCLADYDGNVHLSLRKLCEEVPEKYRHKVYCMHLDNNFALVCQALKAGFRVVICGED